MSPLRVLVVGCGNMGASHARAYHRMPAFDIVGLVSRRPETRSALSQQLGGLPTFDDYSGALSATKPDVVSINTYADTHAPYAEKAIAAGCHVFCEKPLAETVEQAERIVRLAAASGRKLVVGYILRVHPVWMRFVEIAHTLGKPLVMRLNLNQQSHGAQWTTHRHLMESMSPIVDCGVHYVDVMRQMTGANPTRVSAIGARLTEEIVPGRCNYGQLQVAFDDGSVGWYEAGWGPMMSETAYFVKDVIGPGGLRLDRPGSGTGPTRTTSRTIRERTVSGCIGATSIHTASSPNRTRSSGSRTNPTTTRCASANKRSCYERSQRTWISRSTFAAQWTACGSCSRLKRVSAKAELSIWPKAHSPWPQGRQIRSPASEWLSSPEPRTEN